MCGTKPETIIKGNEHTAKRSVVIKCKKCRITLTTSGILSPLSTLMIWSVKQWNTRIDNSSELIEALEIIRAIACGETQVADDDSDGMQVIFAWAEKALAKSTKRSE